MGTEGLVARLRVLQQPTGNPIVRALLSLPFRAKEHHFTECPGLHFELRDKPSGNKGHGRVR
jgi:hypothetical protein